jgi:hypothetical protein
VVARVAALAGDEAGHFYIGPEVGGIVASGDRLTKERAARTLALRSRRPVFEGHPVRLARARPVMRG